MKTLLILRHAKSSWDDPAVADHDRPLNKRGRNDAPAVGKLLRKLNLIPDLILSSTARRAKETAELVIEKSHHQGEFQLTRELYDATPETYVAVLRMLDDSHSSVMVVGHNPILEALVQQLTGHYEKLPTAALVHLNLPIDSWSDLTFGTAATLQTIWRPKDGD